MSTWTQRWEVARWEFERFVKPKQLLASFLITIAMGAMGYWVSRLASRADRRIYDVVVVAGATLGLTSRDTVENISLIPAEAAALDSLRRELGERSLAGVLVLHGSDSAELIVRRDPVWRRALEAHLAATRQRLQLERAGLAPERLAMMLAPVAVRMRFEAGKDGRGARIAAFVGVGLVLYGIFVAMAYMLVSVTGEKQLRVTEQLMSAIPPQVWIDGKIIGIALVSLVNMAVFAVGAVLWVVGRSLALGGGISLGPIDAGALLSIAVFSILGFAFWLAMFGAVAATIDDPNTSTRAPLMFLPAFFSTVGFMIVPNPDSAFARVAGLIPLTAPGVMPARVALTDVPIWEQLLSAALLVAAILVVRLAAGRIFAVAMLMYGKEATWTEMRRWLRQS